MTGRTIVILALVATVFLAVGARLLDGESTGSATLAIAALAIGTALAAAAVAGAWRPAPPRNTDGATDVAVSSAPARSGRR